MSRLDIEKFCSRPGLHIDSKGKAPFSAYSLIDEVKQSKYIYLFMYSKEQKICWKEKQRTKDML